MSKITLNDVTNIDSITTINDNFDKIEQEFQNRVLYRDNVSLENNTIQQDIDLNGKNLINVGGILTLTGRFATVDEVEQIKADVEADRVVVQANKDATDTNVATSTSLYNNTVTVYNNTVGIYNAYHNQYLGAFATDPVVDNSGNTLLEGSLYFYTGSPKIMRIYNGSTWQDVGSFTSSNTTSIDPSLYASQLEAEQGINSTKVLTPLTTKQAIDARTDLVRMTGNQTVAGIKTFSSAPIVPSATSGTNQAISISQVETLINALVPVGLVAHWPGATPPTNWLVRDGSLLVRADYPALWAMANASGNIVSDAAWAARPGSFSTGNGTTTFRIPDARGLVDKGYHGGSGNYTTDTTSLLGRYELDENKAHTHSTGTLGNAGSGSLVPLAAVANVGVTGSQGNAEATVRNASYLPIIKAK